MNNLFWLINMEEYQSKKLEQIIKEIAKMAKSDPEQFDIKSFYSWDHTYYLMNLEPTTSDKITFILNMKSLYNTAKGFDDSKFLKKCDFELEILKEKLEIENLASKSSEGNNSEIGESRRTPSISEVVVDSDLTLLDFFKDKDEFKKVMDILVERGTCQPGTYFLIDNKAGLKTEIALLLKVLHSKGYYKDNRKLKNREIQIILKNTFALDVGIDTIKRAEPSTKSFTFIPDSSFL
jgi:hypothetical protein